ECIEEAGHLGDIPLICPIRRIADEPRCHSPSGGSHEPGESIHRNIYFTAELPDCLRPSHLTVPAGDVGKTAAKTLQTGFKARHLLLSPFQLLRGAGLSMDRVCHESMKQQDVQFCKQNCLHNCITLADLPHLERRLGFQALGCAEKSPSFFP